MNKVRTGFVAGVTALLVIIGIGSASATPLAPNPAPATSSARDVVLSEAEVQVLALAAPGHTFSYDTSVELFELRKRLGSVGFAAVCVARVKAARTPWWRS